MTSDDQVLRGRAAGGGALFVVAQGMRMLIQLGSLVVLARLLAPEDFGVIALAMAIIAFGELVRDFGLTAAAMQAPSLNPTQQSTLFWVNSGLAALLSLMTIAATVPLSHVFGEVHLANVLGPLSAVLLLNGFQAQFQVHLARTHRFVALAVTDVVSQLLGVAVAIGLAAAGFGYIALIAQHVLIAAALCIGRALASDWRPRFTFRPRSIRAISTYGGEHGVAQALTYAALNVDTYLIGSQLGMRTLGVYNRAYQLLALPVNQVMNPLTSVALPALSKLIGDRIAFYQFLRRAQFSCLFVSVFGFACLAAFASDVVDLVFGPQWVGAKPLVIIFAIGGPFWTLTFVGYWQFLAMARMRALVGYGMVTKPLMIGAVLLGSNWGPVGVASAISVCLGLSWPICLLWLQRIAAMPVRTFLGDGCALLAVGTISGVLMHQLQASFGGSPLGLLLAVAVGLSVYVLGVVLLPSQRALLRDVGSRILEASAGPRRRSHTA